MLVVDDAPPAMPLKRRNSRGVRPALSRREQAIALIRVTHNGQLEGGLGAKY